MAITKKKYFIVVKKERKKGLKDRRKDERNSTEKRVKSTTIPDVGENTGSEGNKKILLHQSSTFLDILINTANQSNSTLHIKQFPEAHIQTKTRSGMVALDWEVPGSNTARAPYVICL